MNLIKDKNELALEFPKLTVYRPKFYSLKYNDNVTMDAIGMAESIPDPRFK